MSKFNELGLEDDILKVIERLGFEEPTEIQQKTIPLVLDGQDVLAGSETGSGKTLAFGLGIIQQIHKGNGIQSLIMAPTRELVEQIMKVIKDASSYKKLSVIPIYGGVSINPQFKALERADIVVGTPGRLLDHLERGTIDLSSVKHLVLDEADRMLDMGFIDDVRKIMGQCTAKKQVLLFSATLPPEIDRLSKKFMNNPARVKAGSYVDPTKLHQEYYDVQTSMKFSLLAHLLKQEQKGLVMVFCNSRRYTDSVAKNLKKQRFDAMAIHGGLTQAMRKQVLDKFNSGHAFVLVCTDVAARGLDIPGVSHVYNYDIPDDQKQYIHRIGRTARAGEEGKVVNLISDRDYDNFNKVLRDFDVDVKKMERPFIEKIEMTNSSRNDRGNSRKYSNDRGGRSYGGRSDGRGSNNRSSDSRGPRSGGRYSRDSSHRDSPRERFGNRQSRRDYDGGSRRDNSREGSSSSDRNFRSRSTGPRRSSGYSRSEGSGSRDRRGPRTTAPRSSGPRSSGQRSGGSRQRSGNRDSRGRR